ncbi:MAG: hypothetical protein JNL32_09475 [Candidatus Kapabacteria bacterium]|nr:hypothetical protein [Candidatus Kapabacteria bacterium]
MNFTIGLFSLLMILIGSAQSSFAQLTLGVRGAYCTHYSMPDGMRGTAEQMYTDYLLYGDAARYPFAAHGTVSSRFALDGEYFILGALGVYGSFGTTSFYAELPNTQQNASMRLATLSAGLATKMDIAGGFSWLARLGMNTSAITGKIKYDVFGLGIKTATMITAIRGGIELETGFRYRVTPRIDVEAVATGSVMNLVGRNSNTSYSLGEGEFYLNDGVMTRNGKRIAEKDISYLMFQLGVRYSL